MLPDLGTLTAALVAAAFAAAVLALVSSIRGTVPDPTRPPGRWHRAGTALREPALLGRVLGAGAAFLVALVLTRWIALAGGAAVLVLCWPLLFGGRRAEQQEIDRLEALVVWTESLRDTVGAHATLEQAIPSTADRAPDLIRPHLVRLVGLLRARVPLGRGLESLAVSLDDASADRILAPLIMNVQRRGDGLGAVLTGLAASAREELEMRRKVTAQRTAIRRSTLAIVLVVVTFLGFLATIGRTYVEPYSSFVGQLVLVGVVGLFALSFMWMRRLSVPDKPEPFLARPGKSLDAEQVRVVANLTGLSGARVTALADKQATRPNVVPVKVRAR